MANLTGQSANPGVAGVPGESSTFNGVLGHRLTTQPDRL